MINLIPIPHNRHFAVQGLYALLQRPDGPEVSVFHQPRTVPSIEWNFLYVDKISGQICAINAGVM